MKKKIGLIINEDKTKYMVITRSNNRVGHSDIDFTNWKPNTKRPR